MTSFNVVEFNAIWNIFRDHIEKNYNTGRGAKSPIKAKDLLFVKMSVLKHCSKWDLMAYLFGLKSATFEKRISHLIMVLSAFLYNRLVEYYNKRYTMEKLLANKKTFKSYKFCRYPTNVTFEQSFRPGGALEEAEKYFSGKYILYGFKTEVSVLPNGLAIGASKHHAGSTTEIEIMREMMSFHDYSLQKSAEESRITDIGLLSEKYPDDWSALVDKGHAGICADVRAVRPKKKPPGGMLSLSERRENEAISSDRVLVKNYCRSQAVLWTAVANKYPWSQDSYDNIFRLTLALTNLHVKWHPLLDEDGKTYERYRKRLQDISETTAEKRRRWQASYRRKLQRMMQRSLEANYDAEKQALFEDEGKESPVV